MTKTETAPPPFSLHARLEERILAPLRRSSATRTWFVVTVAAILALHGAMLLVLLLRDRAAEQSARHDETPIEVVVEKPPEPPPPQKQAEAPKPSPKQAEIEKPATSAPRVPTETKVDTAALDKETHAPKAPAPPSDGQPEQKDAAASPSDEPAKPAPSKEAAAEKTDDARKEAEALDTAKPKPEKKPAKVAKASPRHKTKQVSTALQRLAGASALPDYSFARPTKKSPVYGGSEDSRYLAIVYGMIMMHRQAVATDSGGTVTVGFNVDDSGNLTGMGIQRSSGDPAIDAAAVGAIRRASPFPPPPSGSPRGLVATIDFSDPAPVYTMGSQDR